MSKRKTQEAEPKKEKREPEVVTLILTNRQLIALRDGLKGFLNYPEPIDRDALWNADSILERIEGPTRVADRARTRIIEGYARKDEKEQPMKRADETGRTSYVIPKKVRPLLDDDVDAFMDEQAKATIIFPASWCIPYDAIPKLFIGPWLKGLRPVVVRKTEDQEGEGVEGGSDATEAA